MAKRTRQALWWVPWAFVGFFVVVVAVNGVMVGLALWTFPGLATEGAYEKGLAYNAALASARAQARLGWRVEAGYDAGAVTVRLADAAGRPISDARVSVRLRRPTRGGLDRAARAEPRGQGRYVAGLAAPLAGIWDLGVTVVRGTDSYRTARRIEVMP